MKLQASFSAVGLMVLVAAPNGDWSGLLDRQEPSEAVDIARCVSHIRMSERVQHYEFFGSRADEAGQSLRQRLLVTTDYQGRRKSFTGQTDWSIEWRGCFEAIGKGCRIAGVISTVNVTYTLPRWAGNEYAAPGLHDRWNRYLTSLAAHEKGHGEIARRVAEMIEGALVGLSNAEQCDSLDAEAALVVDGVMRHGELMQRAYDRDTGHGSAQGAQFPF